MIDKFYKAYNGDCTEIMKSFKDESVDVILTDPPYLYLKNQKLDVPFDEELLFKECYRVLKKDGFIILFGRGTSFYRWNTILADFGFNFKEEIVWNKSHCTSPLMRLSRVHETVSISTKGEGTINKVKVPYLEMKSHDLDSVIGDVKRMRSILKNTKSLEAVLAFLENNKMERDDYGKGGVTHNGVMKPDRCVSVMSCIEGGLNEKSIIRTDRTDCDTFTKFKVNADKRKTGDRCANVVQSMTFGLNEKSIIKQVRDHYSAIHPTQKPVRLLERLLALVIPQNKDKEDIVVLDPFAGSFSTGVASINLGCYPILIELDKEYFEKGEERLKKDCQQLALF